MDALSAVNNAAVIKMQAALLDKADGGWTSGWALLSRNCANFTGAQGQC